MEFDSERKCALCLTNTANDTNTHYLTDSVIRRCLNEGGSKIRAKTSSYEITLDLNDKTHSKEYKFGQKTSQKSIEKALKRSPTDEEIEEAKKTDKHAVDYVFCRQCEKMMADEIESPFASILNKFRAEGFKPNTATPKPSVDNVIDGYELFNQDNDIKKIRLFFLLQLWRTSVCISNFKLDNEIEEMIRTFIIDCKTVNVEELKKIPLAVSHINIKSDYTTGIVTPIKSSSKYLIFMCDFLIEYIGSNSSDRRTLGKENQEETQFEITIFKESFQPVLWTVFSRLVS